MRRAIEVWLIVGVIVLGSLSMWSVVDRSQIRAELAKRCKILKVQNERVTALELRVSGLTGEAPPAHPMEMCHEPGNSTS